MRRYPILIALGLVAVLTGCQSSIPKYRFDCTFQAYDAGFCNDPQAGRLFGAVIGDR
jgi:hypothetical protein